MNRTCGEVFLFCRSQFRHDPPEVRCLCGDLLVRKGTQTQTLYDIKVIDDLFQRGLHLRDVALGIAAAKLARSCMSVQTLDQEHVCFVVRQDRIEVMAEAVKADTPIRDKVTYKLGKPAHFLLITVFAPCLTGKDLHPGCTRFSGCIGQIFHKTGPQQHGMDRDRADTGVVLGLLSAPVIIGNTDTRDPLGENNVIQEQLADLVLPHSLI